MKSTITKTTYENCNLLNRLIDDIIIVDVTIEAVIIIDVTDV
ncbi:MAG: hypothetical protein AAF705_03675 [Bacteroidota bacterium]